MKEIKTINSEIVNYVPEELIVEGEEKQNSKVARYNDCSVEDVTSPDDDFEFAQRTIKETILQSSEVLHELGQSAIMNENGKMFESYSQLMKNIVDSSSSLVDLHIKLKKAKETKENVSNVQNNLFVGSTKDLLEMIKQNGG